MNKKNLDDWLPITCVSTLSQMLPTVPSNWMNEWMNELNALWFCLLKKKALMDINLNEILIACSEVKTWSSSVMNSFNICIDIYLVKYICNNCLYACPCRNFLFRLKCFFLDYSFIITLFFLFGTLIVGQEKTREGWKDAWHIFVNFGILWVIQVNIISGSSQGITIDT